MVTLYHTILLEHVEKLQNHVCIHIYIYFDLLFVFNKLVIWMLKGLVHRACIIFIHIIDPAIHCVLDIISISFTALWGRWFVQIFFEFWTMHLKSLLQHFIHIRYWNCSRLLFANAEINQNSNNDLLFAASSITYLWSLFTHSWF